MAILHLVPFPEEPNPMTMTRDDYRWSEAVADLFARPGDDDRDEDEAEEES